MWGASWWDAFQAIGTVGAVILALGIALFDYFMNSKDLRKQRKESWKRTASLVSAWVETEYAPSADGRRYDKRAVLKVANESDEPIYDVAINVAIGPPMRQVGPLSAPVPIATLPPRSTRSWDISVGLLAHETTEGFIDFSEPVARVSFSDPRGTRWHRGFNGKLYEDSGETTKVNSEFSPENELQFGQLSPLNPLFTALLFLNAVRDKDLPNLELIKGTIDSQAQGWKTLSQDDYAKLGEKLKDYSVPVHAWYRTDRVAYIRLIPERDLDRQVSSEDGAEFVAKILTLVFRPKEGWKVFSLGATSAEWIDFGPGETHKSIRSFLDDHPA